MPEKKFGIWNFVTEHGLYYASIDEKGNSDTNSRWYRLISSCLSDGAVAHQFYSISVIPLSASGIRGEFCTTPSVFRSVQNLYLNIRYSKLLHKY